MGVPDENYEEDPEGLVHVGQEVEFPLVPLSPTGVTIGRVDVEQFSLLPNGYRTVLCKVVERLQKRFLNVFRTVTERLSNGYTTVTQRVPHVYRTVTERLRNRYRTVT